MANTEDKLAEKTRTSTVELENHAVGMM